MVSRKFIEEQRRMAVDSGLLTQSQFDDVVASHQRADKFATVWVAVIIPGAIAWVEFDLQTVAIVWWVVASISAVWVTVLIYRS